MTVDSEFTSSHQPGDSIEGWRDGWTVGQIEGACSSASKLLDTQDPRAAAKLVLEDLDHRFGNRARRTGAFRDLLSRLRPENDGGLG
ncbi:MAG: hypothetical protein ACE37F_14275 [Nannocystaceae bacterium]|nr:hypothetical protein [bacterium]